MAATESILNDRGRHTASVNLREVNECPDCLLYVPSLYDVSAICPVANQILQDDPFHKVKVFGFINVTLQIVPVGHNGSVVPRPRPNLSLFVETPAIEPVPEERLLSLHLNPIFRSRAPKIPAEGYKFRQCDVVVVDASEEPID